MFFKNHYMFLASRFLWVGLVLGLFYMLCSWAKALSRRNIYVTNIVDFCFWLLSGGVFARMSFVLYNYSFCFFGLISMLAGLILVKISIDFFFTKFAKLLYNKLAKLKSRKFKNGKLQANQKV